MRLSADDYAASMATSLDVYEAMRPRSLQTELGVSSLGHCASEAKFRLLGTPATDAPTARQALFGTAAHDLIGKARQLTKPRLLIEQKLEITMPCGVVIPGHADEIDPDEPSVTDWKTVADEADMVLLRRTGSSEQQRWQRHVYAWGAIQAGLLPAEGVIVRNVWVDRSGTSTHLHVEQEPFDINQVYAADRWLEGVRYAAEHEEETPRDKHHAWCERFCEFFTACRGGQAHPDLIVTDPALVQAAELVLEGRAKEKEGKGIADGAKRRLEPLQSQADGDVASFSAGDYRVRWAWANRAGSADGGHWRLHVDRVASP